LKTKGKDVDLNGIAKGLAHLVHDQLFHVHRGYLRVSKGTYAVYGNDGYDRDKRSQVEAQEVKKEADERGLKASDIQSHHASWAVVLIGTKKNAVEITKCAWNTWISESEKREKVGKAQYEKSQT
jgi:hypothetical protein